MMMMMTVMMMMTRMTTVKMMRMMMMTLMMMMLVMIMMMMMMMLRMMMKMMKEQGLGPGWVHRAISSLRRAISSLLKIRSNSQHFMIHLHSQAEEVRNLTFPHKRLQSIVVPPQQARPQLGMQKTP